MIKSFENGILIGEIVNVFADESVITDTFLDGQDTFTKLLNMLEIPY